MINRQAMIDGTKELGITLSPTHLDKFEKLATLLAVKNQEFNLTSLTPDEYLTKHFLDSLSVLCIDDIEFHGSILDVGTGAGFPGLPLAITCPDLHCVLLDGTEKRLKFVDLVISELGLVNAETLHGRAELLGRDLKYRELYDFVVARAVANLSSLCELCLPLVKIGGYFIAMKGEQAKLELEQANSAISQLGAKLIQEKSLTLPGTDYSRTLFVIEKLTETSERFPRRTKNILDRPLS